MAHLHGNNDLSNIVPDLYLTTDSAKHGSSPPIRADSYETSGMEEQSKIHTPGRQWLFHNSNLKSHSSISGDEKIRRLRMLL